MTTAPTLDELEQSIIDFVIGLCFGEDNKIHGEKAIRDALTSYGTARYDDGVEEERERVREFINDIKHTAFLLGNKSGTYDRMAGYYRTEAFKLVEDFLSDNTK